MSAYLNFNKLSANTYIHQPSTSNDTSPKSIIILCTWMAAQPKLISRYADHLISDFPQSIILLITTSVGEFINLPSETWSQRLDPLVEVLLSYPEVPLRGCVYSNGGVHALNQLAGAYQSRTGSTLPIERLVIDSAPGSPEIGVSHRAMILSLQPPSYAYHLASVILWIYLGMYWTYKTLFGVENPIQVVRDRLNDTRLYKVGEDEERVYIYSKTDQLVPWDSVESSANEAEKKGWEIKLEMFQGSKHVAHAVVDKERYWKTVSDTLR